MIVYRTAALIVVTVALVTACGSATRPAWTFNNSAPTMAATAAVATATPAPVTTPAPTATPAPATATPAPTDSPAPATEFVVTLADAMTIEPGVFTVPAGKPITFVVTNVGQIPHEFTLGDAQVQDEHEQEMMSSGGHMGHDDDNAISLAPGQTKELTYTFEMPGMSLAGCHVPGHYPAGMKASITIVE